MTMILPRIGQSAPFLITLAVFLFVGGWQCTADDGKKGGVQTNTEPESPDDASGESDDSTDAIPGYIIVEIAFPGASAIEVDELISAPFAKLFTQVDGVKNVWSRSRAGLSLHRLELTDSKKASAALEAVRSRIDEMDSVPEAAEEPSVKLAGSDGPGHSGNCPASA